MPELPEVETIRRQLAEKIVGKKIKKIKISVSKLVKGASPTLFRRRLVGKIITGIRRRGKYLIFDLFPSGYLLAHLKLSGRLLYFDPAPSGEPYHIAFLFYDGSALYYHDLRRFGGFALLDKDPLPGLGLGPEPLTPNFTFPIWKKMLAGKSSRVKTFLLDQQRIAGLGNIYASEALFRAGIHPERKVSSLSEAEKKELYRAILSVLKKALAAGGTSIQDYIKPDGGNGNFQKSLFVYRRKGQPCFRCGNSVAVKKDGNRSTYFCPHCQK